MKWNVLLELELKCSLFLMAAFLVILLVRRFSSAQRHFVLMLAVSGGLLVPAAHFLLPHWETKILPPSKVKQESAPQVKESAPAVVQSEPAVAFPAPTMPPILTPIENGETVVPIAASEPITAPEPPAQAAGPVAVEEASISSDQIIAFVWLGGAAIMLLSLVIGWLSAWRIVRRAPAAQGVWSETRERVRGRLAISRKVALLECSSRLAPMAFGLFRAAIVLPVDGRAWPEQKRSAVLVHELAHVKRNDCLLHWICTLALALHWFNPLFWIAARRLRLEREHACDDYVLNNGAEAADYADQLLEVARMQSSRVPLLSAAITMARKNALEGRLLAILDGGRRRGAFGLGAVCLAVLLTVGIALPLASATGARAQAAVENVVVDMDDEVAESEKIPPEDLAEPREVFGEVVDASVEPTAEVVEVLAEIEVEPPESLPRMSLKKPEELESKGSSSNPLPDDVFVSTTPNVWLTSSPPSLFVDRVNVPVIDSGGSSTVDAAEKSAALFLGEWVELTEDAATALHFLVEQNGQALMEGGDVRTRMQWKLNYDELLLTTSDGVRTADISPEGLLIYRKGGRAMMTFRRLGSTAELPEKEPLTPTPSVKEQLENRLVAAASISSSASKNAALSEIALDSAKFGCVDQMQRAVNGISLSGVRNETADQCVDLLLEQGLVKEATELANEISSSAYRDEVLGRIAGQQTVVREAEGPGGRPIPTPTAEMKAQLESRLKIADRITIMQDREAALMGVAADAARMGDVALALTAVGKMRVLTSKAEAAELCADQFILQGMSEEAVQMAEQITLLNKRNEVLARIAQGRSAVTGSGGVSVGGSISLQSRYGRRMGAERQSEYTRQLEARITIAEQITLASERDEVLAGIALDAARLGVVEPALKALDKMTFVSDRDDAAVRCADQFILLDLSEYAGKVAEKITFYNAKKEVIERIARGRTAVGTTGGVVIGNAGGGSSGGQRTGRRPSADLQAEYTQHLEARMTISEQITLPSDRDEILTGIAVDAARLGVIETALKALDKISFVSTRDAAAVRCADQFILQGMTAEAGRVAEKITFYSKKKEVIDKIARGSAPLTGTPARGTPRSTPENGWTIHYSSDDPPSPEQAAAIQQQIEVMQKQMEAMMDSGAVEGQLDAMEKQIESMSKQMESMMNSIGTP
ncbi:MAG: M56 family metallopeptidase [Pontiellaceae bacterium]|nr:M56 family metallopeptidase [Pontiellaceae bacterium]